MTISVKTIISTKDGSLGLYEQSHPSGDEYRRVFIQKGDGQLEHCSLDAFNQDGKMARTYHTVVKVEDLEIG